MIGVFDSGVGGLSVLKHIRDLLPGEELTYVADCAYAPYGSRSAEEIRTRSMAITRFLLSRGARCIVVACNTATSAAVAALRESFDLPIIGMEPAVKPAARDTKTGVVGVLATEGTLASEKFATLLEQHGKESRVISQPCHGFVELVERGEIDSDEARRLVRRMVVPLLEQGADILVLGCTHYPFLMPLIEEIAGPGVAVIDTGIAVARELKRRLGEIDESQAPGKQAAEELWTSCDPERVGIVMRRLWGDSAEGWEVKPLPKL